MGSYSISQFNTAAQKVIKERSVDINTNNYIDDNELSKLLSYTGAKDVNELLGSNYETNSKNNVFFKQYLEGKAMQEGVKIPDKLKINISSYTENKYRKILDKLENTKFWDDSKNWWTMNTEANKSIEEFCQNANLSEEDMQNVIELHKFNDVRVNIFGARISDMFKLLANEKSIVAQKVEQMKISDEEKTKILDVKDFFDKYYKIEAEYNGETFNLLSLSDDEKKKLKEISPEFAEFIEKEQPELSKQAVKFTQEELKANELSSASSSSKTAAGVLATILTANLGKAWWDARGVKKGLIKSEKFINFVKTNPEQGNAILNKCVAKYNKLGEERGMEVISRYMKHIGMEGGEHLIAQKAIFQQGMPKWINPIKAFKSAKGMALVGLILTTLQGGADDCMGAVKDYVQDQNNFGTPTAIGIGTVAVGAGIASSAAIAPTLDGIINYNRAEKQLVKNGLIEKAKGLAKFKKAGKIGLIGGLFGMVVASSSSGSSWASMGLTRLKMGLNGDKLEEKNIISKEENTFGNSNKNMMDYDAYSGKWSGITEGDWTIGAVGGATGLFTHTNPYIQNLSFGLQGCSETLTACGVQLLGDEIRDSKLNKEKEKLVNSVDS